MKANSNDPIEVLILAYNGQAFIEEQITSILNQLRPNDRILVSDDGSTDNTLAIVTRIQENSKNRIEITNGPGKGVIEHFFNAIKKTTQNYVFIADQDDVWLPNKLQLFRNKMEKTEKPHLIFSDALTWRPETDSKTSFWEEQGINPAHASHIRTLLFRNCVQGASMAMNQELIKKLQHPPQNAMMHDWWCALVAAALGKVSAIPHQTLLYRQHTGNQLGSNLKRSFSQKRAATEAIFKQAIEFNIRLRRDIQPEDAQFLSDFCHSINGTVIQRFMFIISHRPIRSNTLRTITLWSSILFHRTK